ncbi:MAG: Hsp20/alpha crystallin family protein [Lentisphaerae bacterium]|nr:Hsp20/alpha crystallin family protein [Lentisphaerota bacterium]
MVRHQHGDRSRAHPGADEERRPEGDPAPGGGGQAAADRGRVALNPTAVERSCGRFERAVALPHGIGPGQVKARFKNGVLQGTLPKTPQHRSCSRAIEITAG